MRHFPIIFTEVALLLTTFSCLPKEESASLQPNVILFLIDDFGYADISYEGNTQINTPHIDRIAQNGAHFTHFYQSGAACAPTRASLLTGRYHLETGVWGVHAGRDFIHRDEVTLADVLKGAGYTTGAFGKWHSGKTWPYFSWNRGFDVGIHSKLYQYFDSHVIYNNKLIHIDGPVTEVIGDQVVRFIEENWNTPFFAYVPFQSIHEPYNCPEDVFLKYKSWGYSDHVARLYGMIEVLDNSIGKILDAVERLELMENTVVLFLSDDGPSPGFDLSYSNRRMNDAEKAERKRGWAKEYRGGKGTIWQGGAITPFYIQWRGKIRPGSEYEELAGVVDLFPTILDLCGVEYENPALPIRGKSLKPVLFGETPVEWKERRYFDNTNFYLIERKDIDMNRPQMHHIALYYKDYKLIRGDNTLYGGPSSVYYELYDLARDPMESDNLIDKDPDMADLLIPEVERWYDDILNSGRAFQQAVYEIGHWEERISPINLDAVRDLWGSVTRSERSAFRYENWTMPGSGMNFEIEVVEGGFYVAELGFNCEPEGFGSEFAVFTPFDTAGLRVQHISTGLSDTLHLPPGRQLLNIELKTLGKGGRSIEVLKSILVHRIPDLSDTDVVQNAGINLSNQGGVAAHFLATSATADFMLGGAEQEVIEVLSGEEIQIEVFADNPDRIATATLYLGFEVEKTISAPPFIFSLTPSETGRQTLNVELKSKTGVVNAVHGDIMVVADERTDVN